MFARSDSSLLARWWWTIDRWLLFLSCLLIVLGIIFVFAASPAVATKIGLPSFYFIKRHIAYMFLGIVIMVAISLMNEEQIRLFSAICIALTVLGIIATLIFGVQIKGARRWLSLAGLSIQPTEFLKPVLVVMCAWLFAEQKEDSSFPGNKIAVGLVLFCIALTLAQPDVGTSFLITCVFIGQFILAGLPLLWVASSILLGVTGLLGAYFLFPHVSQRIDRFLFATNTDKYSEGYQISQSLEALHKGGWLGRGPGEGIIKKNLPDAHADFIFSVAGEEFGVIICVALILLFGAILLRTTVRIIQDQNLFRILAVSGLMSQIVLQAIINMSSAVHLIPTKGMTLPFISYGGSSVLATSISMGIILGFTRRYIRETHE